VLRRVISRSRWPAAFLLLCLPVPAAADAIIRTQAMFASTIVEYFIVEDGLDVKLEIGLSDLPAFGNLMPNEIYEKLGNAPLPLAQRLPEFFETDFVVLADERRLPGRVTEMHVGERVRRDEVTGEPLPAQAEEPETVIFVKLEYEFAGQPRELTLGGRVPSATSVGFVAYHDTIAVNDFRYLTLSQTLELDWADPWYTSFRTRALRRSYSAPMTGFIYVEPYEVRKEIIVRPKDLQSFVDLGLSPNWPESTSSNVRPVRAG
jgi:hypothetical protein